ncbi:MAG TPA: HAMP domain-containing sensor histidine kinase, partial [Chitinophaga sp.]|nr:HAMP domain-containing sensor histidine kinase [Chitinophaga sp.]
EMRPMEKLYLTDTTAFKKHTQQILSRIFTKLIREQNMDSLLKVIRKRGNITDSLKYSLRITSMDVKFSDGEYVNIYDRRKRYPLIDEDLQSIYGIRIYGNLPTPDDNNQILNINVTTPEAYTYAMGFAFNADPYNRQQLVLRQMQFILIMSLLSMLAIIILFFTTLRNWIKQKHLSDVKTDFINNITHEFHTPLTAIMVANKNIRNAKVLDNKIAIRSLSDIIERQSQRLKLLISQVLDIAAIDKLFVQKKPHDLNILVSDILTDFSIKFSSANVQIIYKRSEDNVVADADNFHFTTLMLNILDNAVKYNVQPVKHLLVSITHTNENIEISISDNGIGMSKDTIKRIFDKFYRHQKDLTQNTKGLGLGLYYVKQCIDAHQWKLKVDSEAGKGSTFVIVIPV